MSRRTPFDEIEQLFERMGRQFEDASQQWEAWNPQEVGTSTASVDVVDDGDEFRVTVDLPGFEPDDVDLRLVDRTLYLDATRSEETSVDEENFVHQERTHESITRSVQLPEPVDVDDVTATMENGVLSLTVPKVDPTSNGHPIDIE